MAPDMRATADNAATSASPERAAVCAAVVTVERRTRQSCVFGCRFQSARSRC